jgi:hypothetical protein
MSCPKWFDRVWAVWICILLVASPVWADEVVYTNDFNGDLNSTFAEWSSSPITYFNSSTPEKGATLDAPEATNVDSPNRKERYLGPFGGPRLAENTKDFNRTRVEQTIRLALEKLPPHKSVTASFDLYILSSWDGNNPHYGPDRWSLAVDDGPTLLKATFSNNPKTGAYDLSNQDYPRKNSKFQTGAAAVNTLGARFFGDSTYKLSYTFDHADDGLVLTFHSDLFEGKGTDDEAWGLDNVKVVVHSSAAKSRQSRAGSPVNPDRK